MGKILILAILFVLSSTYALGNSQDKYELCEISGIAGGANDSFTQIIVMRILEKQGLLYEHRCSIIGQDGYKFGKQYSTGSLSGPDNGLRWKKYQDFRDKISDKIIEMIGY